MPHHTSADLLKVVAIAIDQHFAQYPLMAIQIVVLHHHKLCGNQIG